MAIPHIRSTENVHIFKMHLKPYIMPFFLNGYFGMQNWLYKGIHSIDFVIQVFNLLVFEVNDVNITLTTNAEVVSSLYSCLQSRNLLVLMLHLKTLISFNLNLFHCFSHSSKLN